MKILNVTTVSGTINVFLVPHIVRLLELGHQVDIACHITLPIHQVLVEKGCKIYNLDFQRSPFKWGNIRAYRELKKIINEGDYSVIHTHTPVASLLVRFACRKKKDLKIIYTAHGFHFYKGAPIRNWLLYYSIEKYLSKYTDILITINSEDYLIAKNMFKAKTVLKIPGVGIDLNYFDRIEPDETLMDNLGIPHNSFVLISVGELNDNKNHETIIKALSKIKSPNIYYLICGSGPNYEKLHQLIKDLKLNDNVKLMGLLSREEIGKLLKTSDLFIFPSYREGLSVALMEAMTCGLPVVCSNIRGNRDLIDNEKGGYLVQPDDSDSFKKAILKLYGDRELCYQMGNYNKKKIQSFSTVSVLKEIEGVYRSIDDG